MAATLPDTTVSESDPGDDTLERFRYQLTYTTILWLSLLDEESTDDYIYCEHHEDVLLKRRTELFCGIQIKTQDISIGPFKAGDAPIIKTIKRFVKLEQQFPSVFDTYVIAANCDFWHGAKNGQSISFILELAKEVNQSKPATLPSALKSFLKRIVTDEKLYERAIDVLSKVELQTGMPGIKDVRNRLVECLGAIDTIGEKSLHVVVALADHLVNHVFLAASHGCEVRFRDYNAVLKYSTDAKALTVISGKRKDKHSLTELIASALAPDSVLLSHGAIYSPLPDNLTRLERGLADAEFTIRTIDLLKRFARSTDHLVTSWLAKYVMQPNKALGYYDHLRLVVQSECNEVFIRRTLNGEPLGEHMYLEVRTKLRQRYDEERANLPPCSFEHFLGMAAILTEEEELSWR